MIKITPQAVPPVAANSTGGQEPARDVSPAGPFSYSNAAPAHLIEDDGFVTVYPPLKKDEDQW